LIAEECTERQRQRSLLCEMKTSGQSHLAYSSIAARRARIVQLYSPGGGITIGSSVSTAHRCAQHTDRQTDRHRTRDTAAGCSQCAWVEWTVSNIHMTSETITQLVVQYSDGGTTGAAAAHSQPDHTAGRGRMGVPCPLSASLPSLLHPMSLTGHQKAQCRGVSITTPF